jgi:hypothetical protein
MFNFFPLLPTVRFSSFNVISLYKFVPCLSLQEGRAGIALKPSDLFSLSNEHCVSVKNEWRYDSIPLMCLYLTTNIISNAYTVVVRVVAPCSLIGGYRLFSAYIFKADSIIHHKKTHWIFTALKTTNLTPSLCLGKQFTFKYVYFQLIESVQIQR